MTRVAVNGAAGRMGRAVIEAAGERDDLDVVVGFHVDDVDDIQGSPSTTPTTSPTGSPSTNHRS